MSERVDHTRQPISQVTRRGVLKTGLSTAVGLGVASLSPVEPRVAVAAPEGKRGGHGYVLNYAYPESWDPHISGTLAANAAISPMYNQVVEFNPLNPKEVIGDLAKGWEVSDDGTVYTFQLHENVHWWDGQALTAEDVAFSINRMIEPGQPRPRVGLLRPSTKQAEVVDPYTVRVHLNYPSPSFLPFLAVDYMKVVPKHVIEAGKDINNWQNVVGSGPFKIVKARRGDSVTYERNANYFKPGLPYLDRLTVLAMSDAGTAAAAIKANKIVMTTAATALSIDDMVKLATDLKGRVSLYWQPEVTDGWHVFANVEREPWTDLRIIQALRLATDQQEHQQAFGEGHYKMGAPFPVGSWYGSTTEELLKLPGYRQPKDSDIADAIALLKAAGYESPSKLGQRVLNTGTVSFIPDVAQLWVAQMRRNLGLDIKIKLLDGPTTVQAQISGDFDLSIFGYGFNIADPDDWVNAVYGPGARNYTRWKNPTFLEMFAKQSREVDRDQRRQILRHMEQFLQTVEDPYIQLNWKPWVYLASDKVRTAAGPFVTPPTIQTVLKHEHWWLDT